MLGKGQRVFLRFPEPTDLIELQELIRSSKSLHEPWAFLDDSAEAVQRFLAERRGERSEAYLLCESSSDQIAGVFRLSEIVRGPFQNAFLSFYAHTDLQGRGYMTEGLGLVVAHAFTELGLHRLEANIQPENKRSRHLVERCGFRLEGFSPRYLKIGDTWRDHERWAITKELVGPGR